MIPLENVTRMERFAMSPNFFSFLSNDDGMLFNVEKNKETDSRGQIVLYTSLW